MMEKIKYKRIKIPVSDRKDFLATAGNLPYHPEKEIGGYITPASIYYTVGSADNVPIGADHAFVFHTHPCGRMQDIPSELDILNMVFLPWQKSLLLTPHKLILISKTPFSKTVLEGLDRTHQRYAVDVATRLHSSGPENAFYFLMKKFMKSNGMDNALSSSRWPALWETLVTRTLRMDLRYWDCVPLAEAA